MTRISTYLRSKNVLTPSDLKSLTFYIDMIRDKVDLSDVDLDQLYGVVSVVSEEPAAYLDDCAKMIVYDVLDRLDELDTNGCIEDGPDWDKDVEITT